MRFRPCIDIHNGKIKQIVGGSLTDEKCESKALSHSIIYGSYAELSAICNGRMCERKALSHSIIYGSTADLSAVCNGSKSVTDRKSSKKKYRNY